MRSMNREQQWEEVAHTADWALRVWGSTYPELFENAADGMINLVGGDPDQDAPQIIESFELQAPDWETLLIDWLTELIWLIEDQHVVLTQFKVQCAEDHQLTAQAAGRPGGHFHKHIKAATYHDLDIRKTERGYETVIVFDV